MLDSRGTLNDLQIQCSPKTTITLTDKCSNVIYYTTKKFFQKMTNSHFIVILNFYNDAIESKVKNLISWQKHKSYGGYNYGNSEN